VNLVVTRDELRRLLGTSERTLSRLVTLGVIRPRRRARGTTGGTYELTQAVPAFLRHARESTGSTGAARDARDRSQAELNLLHLAKERRAILPRAQVVAEGQAYIAATAGKLRAIPGRAVQAGSVAEERQGELEDLIEATIGELAQLRQMHHGRVS
jgi:hypothetical protein